MGKNIVKNMYKNLSSKYSQKPLDHAKQSSADALKTASKRVVHKTARATRGLIGILIKLQKFTTIYFRKG